MRAWESAWRAPFTEPAQLGPQPSHSNQEAGLAKTAITMPPSNALACSAVLILWVAMSAPTRSILRVRIKRTISADVALAGLQRSTRCALRKRQINA